MAKHDIKHKQDNNMGRSKKTKGGGIDFTAVIREHIRDFPPQLAREAELEKLFNAALEYVEKTPVEREENRKTKARWLAMMDKEARPMNDEIYKGSPQLGTKPMDEAIAAVWNNRNLGFYRHAVTTTGWNGAEAMEKVYKNGWDCTQVTPTGFLQELPADHKKRTPEKKLDDRIRKPGQDVSRLPDHAKVQGSAEECWASWNKKVLQGPAAKHVVEIQPEEAEVWPTSIFGVRQQFELSPDTLRFEHRKVRPCADCRGINATMESAEKIHYTTGEYSRGSKPPSQAVGTQKVGSHDAIIGSLSTIMTGRRPIRIQSRKNVTHQIKQETSDRDRDACRFESDDDTSEKLTTGKRSRDEAEVEEVAPPTKRRRTRAGLAKRDWENYYFSLPVSRESRRWNQFKIWDPVAKKTRIYQLPFYK